jgi:hypothetical protein
MVGCLVMYLYGNSGFLCLSGGPTVIISYCLASGTRLGRCTRERLPLPGTCAWTIFPLLRFHPRPHHNNDGRLVARLDDSWCPRLAVVLSHRRSLDRHSLTSIDRLIPEWSTPDRVVYVCTYD